MSTKKDGVFFGGVPTEPDIRALRDAYPESEMTAGTVIPYEAVEEIIGVGRDENRWKSVTNRWRKVVERETGRVVIGVEAGVGFRVLDAVQKIDLGHSKLATAGRHARRAYVLTARVETAGLSDEEKARLMNLQKRSGAFIAAAQIKSTAELPTLGSS